MSTTPAPPVLALPEHLPEVSFDIGLGQKYAFVDFDYAKFDQQAEGFEMSPEDRAALSIEVVDVSKYSPVGAFFSGDENTIVLGAGNKANTALAHELQHAADHSHGTLDEQPLRSRIGVKSLPVFYGVVCVDAAVWVTALTGSEVARSVAAGPYLSLATLAIVGTTMWGYRFHPVERRAFKAQKHAEADVVTLLKK
jgi:hypothetical protein